MQPKYEVPPTMMTNDYRSEPWYRGLRWRIRWAGIINYLSGIANLLLGYFILRDIIHYQLDDTYEIASAITELVFGTLMLVFGFLIMRRMRWAAGASIALGIINILFTLYSVFTQGAPITLIVGSTIYTWLNSRAYTAIPDILSYEKPQKI